MSQPIVVGGVWLRGDVPFIVTALGSDEGGPQVCASPLGPNGAAMSKSFWYDEADFLAKFRLKGSPPEPPPPPAEFQVGDAVQLKGGQSKDDPTMTVTRVNRKFLTADGDDTPERDRRVMDAVWVAYVPRYGESGAILRDRFPAAALRTAAPEPVPPETG